MCLSAYALDKASQCTSFLASRATSRCVHTPHLHTECKYLQSSTAYYLVACFFSTILWRGQLKISAGRGRISARPSALGSNVSSSDETFMARALSVAATAKGETFPNPAVGCVIVSGDNVVGEGYHPKAGAPHAEVFALRAAGQQAKGATAYVTLEPCNHHGRTPPCSLALVEAGVARVRL